MTVISFESHTPKVAPSCFTAPDSWVIGDVVIGEDSSVFFGAVLRGDILPIRVGRGTNIQEHSLLHTSHGLEPCVVGDNVTVGHRAILHGCTVSSNCIIGMGSILLDGADIGEYSIVGAHSLVPMNKKFPGGVLILGSPAKVIRELTAAEKRQIELSAASYRKVSAHYRVSVGSKPQ